MRIALFVVLFISACACSLLGACAYYVTPGPGADMAALTGQVPPSRNGVTVDSAIVERMSRKPAASFPAIIAAVHLQGPAYRSYSTEAYGEGKFTLVNQREAETESHFNRLSRLPAVRSVALLNRMMFSNKIDDDKDLRRMAAGVQADIVLAYTFDTRFTSSETIPVLSPITLGLFPTDLRTCKTTASAALLDTRTGFIYGLAEATGESTRLGNAWSSQSTLDNARIAAEREAFDNLVTELERTWRGVAAAYAPISPPPAAALDK